MNEHELMLPKCEFITSADLLNQAQYIMQDVIEDFFEKYNSDNADDLKSIAWEFKRSAAAKAGAVFRIILDISKEFERLGITE